MVQIHYRFQDEIKNSFKNSLGGGFGSVSRAVLGGFHEPFLILIQLLVSRTVSKTIPSSDSN
jgi:hypothetical protein